MKDNIGDIRPRRVKQYDTYSRQHDSLRPGNTADSRRSNSEILHKPNVDQSNITQKNNARRNHSGSMSGFLDTRAKPSTEQSQIKIHEDQSVPAQMERTTVTSTSNATVDDKSTQQSIEPVITPGKYKSTSAYQKLFYATGMAVFAFALFVSIQTLSQNKQVEETIDVLGTQSVQVTDDEGVSQGTGNDPSDDKPDDGAISSYQVSPNAPRYIRIASQSVNARVKNLGLTSTGAVDAPANVHDAGWYRDSVLPGSKSGVSLILGHVSGWSTPGVFKNIKSLSPGEIIEIEKGDGTILRYSVEKTEEYSVDAVDMAKILHEVPTGEHSLRLMTCSGNYNKQTDSYESRTVVYASPA